MSPAAASPHVPAPGDAVADLPARDPNAQGRARAREAGPPAPARMAMIQRAAPGLVSGSSLWHAQPHSLAQMWDMHVTSARYFEAGLLRAPRYIWGALHIAVAGPLYLLVWVQRSIPLFVLFAAVVAAGIWLW